MISVVVGKVWSECVKKREKCSKKVYIYIKGREREEHRSPIPLGCMIMKCEYENVLLIS